MKDENIEINIQLFLKTELSFEQFFILHCLANKNQNLLETYVLKRGSFDKSVFLDLIEKGYLFPIDSQITYDVLQLKPKYYNDFQLTNELNHERYFEELRELYPKKVKGRAALHTDLEKCRKKYKEICISEDKHKLVMECLRLYLKDLADSGKMEYIQMLPTWLNQKSYQAYEYLVEKGIKAKEKEDFIDDI